MESKMSVTEIRQAAKNLVAHNGPWKVLEFAEELIRNTATDTDARWINRDAIILEAHRQAVRVLDFLGL